MLHVNSREKKRLNDFLFCRFFNERYDLPNDPLRRSSLWFSVNFVLNWKTKTKRRHCAGFSRILGDRGSRDQAVEWFILAFDIGPVIRMDRIDPVKNQSALLAIIVLRTRPGGWSFQPTFIGSTIRRCRNSNSRVKLHHYRLSRVRRSKLRG